MKHKTSVAMGLRAFNIQFGNTIVRQGDPIRGFFFVLHGQAKISMEPALHVTQYPDMCLEKTDSALNGILAELLPGRKVKDKKDKSHNLRLSGPNLSRRRDGYAAAERQRNVRTIDVCLVGSNDIIGDTEIAFNMDTYMQTVTCIQNARVYELDLKNFERLVVKRNPETLKVMKSIVEVKLTSRLNSAKKAKVPLLSILLEKIIEMNKPPPVKDKRRRNEDNELDRRCSKDPLLPPRGPIIDQFGPGSLMYRNKVKEKQRRRFHERRLRTTTRKKADLIDPITGKMNVNPALATQMNTTNNHTQTGKGKTRPYTAPGAITTESTFKGLHAVIEDDDEKDSVYEATDTELSLLEDRIRNWHSYEDETKPLIVPRPQKLHRVKLSKDSWARKRISPRVKGCKSAKSETNINNTKMYMHDRTVAFQENNNHAGDEEFMENSTSGKRSIHTDGDTAYDSGRESNIESDKEDEATPTGKVSSVPTPSTSPLTSKKYYTLRKIKPSRSYSAEDYKALRELLRKAQKRQGHMLSSSVCPKETREYPEVDNLGRNVTIFSPGSRLVKCAHITEGVESNRLVSYDVVLVPSIIGCRSNEQPEGL
uniref:Uncharacterized protein LOC102810008 n=1 Tax=Saccoglossus kowalevskii TaxID=10224 RepID=A0ABM0N188_SACKO|nr:PREDICTED: uncharacterized protein LOC102810008 [Saccoglossus kowalevskii]